MKSDSNQSSANTQRIKGDRRCSAVAEAGVPVQCVLFRPNGGKKRKVGGLARTCRAEKDSIPQSWELSVRANANLNLFACQRQLRNRRHGRTPWGERLCQEWSRRPAPRRSGCLQRVPNSLSLVGTKGVVAVTGFKNLALSAVDGSTGAVTPAGPAAGAAGPCREAAGRDRPGETVSVPVRLLPDHRFPSGIVSRTCSSPARTSLHDLQLMIECWR